MSWSFTFSPSLNYLSLSISLLLSLLPSSPFLYLFLCCVRVFIFLCALCFASLIYHLYIWPYLYCHIMVRLCVPKKKQCDGTNALCAKENTKEHHRDFFVTENNIVICMTVNTRDGASLFFATSPYPLLSPFTGAECSVFRFLVRLRSPDAACLPPMLLFRQSSPSWQTRSCLM